MWLHPIPTQDVCSKCNAQEARPTPGVPNELHRLGDFTGVVSKLGDPNMIGYFVIGSF